MQTPGVDYMERYFSVATDTTIRLVITVCLYYGWMVETIDIEAAFFEGEIEEPAYMEWPPGMLKLDRLTLKRRLPTLFN